MKYYEVGSRLELELDFPNHTRVRNKHADWTWWKKRVFCQDIIIEGVFV